MAALTEQERARIPDEDFAVPQKRVLPIHDAEHARLAWDMLDRTHGLTQSDREGARHRIMRALHRYGVKFARGVEESAQRQLSGQGGEFHALEAEIVDEPGHVVEVTIVRPGVSQNGFVYSESVLREATPLWSGAPAFVDHPSAMDLSRAGGRSLRDLVGVYEQPTYAEVRGIRARLRLGSNGGDIFSTIREAIEGRSSGRVVPPIGISADWKLLSSPGQPGSQGEPRRLVHAITKVNSGDLVIRPSAGGSFDRILEATDVGEMPTTDYSAWVPWEGEVVAEAGQVESVAGERVVEAVNQGSTSAAEVARLVAEALAPVQEQLRQSTLEAKLAAARLPQGAEAFVRAQLGARVFEAAEIDATISDVRTMLGQVFGQSSIRGVGSSILDAGAVQGVTALEKLQAGWDCLFGLDVPAPLSGVPRLTGVREGYVLTTGDKYFTGNYVREEMTVREANEVTLSVLSNVVKYAKQLQFCHHWYGTPGSPRRECLILPPAEDRA